MKSFVLAAACLCNGALAPAQRPLLPAHSLTEIIAPESLDLEMYSRIRDEGFNHSYVMQYAGALTDDIGPRLTGSPAMMRANEWARAQLAAMGCSNTHLESWGEFGMAWTQRNTSVAMQTPSAGVFHAQATPWSPSTHGPVTKAEVVFVPELKEEKAFQLWKGQLRGKVILYGGDKADYNPDKAPAFTHLSPKDLHSLTAYPPADGAGEVTPTLLAHIRAGVEQSLFQLRVGEFFKAEGAVAILVPGGSGGVLHDDINSSLSWFVYEPQHRQEIPEAVIATENYDRMLRLLQHKVPVSVDINIDTAFGNEHAIGYNTIAEIPGTDPTLKDEVVMVGGHLDSWIGGTGATDNGAGAVVAMEAIRILKTLKVHPRRTIRIALWGGEEELMYGSVRYVDQHFATVTENNSPQNQELPDLLRPMTALPTLTHEGAKLDAYYNLDEGTGKILGIYTGDNQGAGAIFAQWIKPIEDLGVTTISERQSGLTDHVAFQRVGLPGYAFLQDPRDYEDRTHHSDLDTFEHLSEPDLKQAAVVEAIFLYNTAQRDRMLPRPVPPSLPKQLPDLYPDAAK